MYDPHVNCPRSYWLRFYSLVTSARLGLIFALVTHIRSHRNSGRS